MTSKLNDTLFMDQVDYALVWGAEYVRDSVLSWHEHPDEDSWVVLTMEDGEQPVLARCDLMEILEG